MILKLNKSTSEEQLSELIERIKQLDCDCQVNKEEGYIIVGVLGDISDIDIKLIEEIDIVESITRLDTPYILASRNFHPSNSVVRVNESFIGDDNLTIIAGPCSVENKKQMDATTKYISESGIKLLRGGIVKPRTSPYSFQGLEEKGLELMEEARDKYGFSLVVELTSVAQVEKFSSRIDMIQIGARNMQNFDLLNAVGKQDKPVLLKRGFAATLEEWLMSAEYIMAQGNLNVVLCERGIRTFENAYRNVSDINAIPMLKKITHLPIIVDPSHATGISWMIKDITLASIAAGADGIMVETHYKPEIALSDGPQSLNEEQFKIVVEKADLLASFLLNNK